MNLAFFLELPKSLHFSKLIPIFRSISVPLQVGSVLAIVFHSFSLKLSYKIKDFRQTKATNSFHKTYSYTKNLVHANLLPSIVSAEECAAPESNVRQTIKRNARDNDLSMLMPLIVSFLTQFSIKMR